MSNPEDEPLGGKPILPPPSREARDRAHPLFTRLVNERTRTVEAEPTRVAQPVVRPTFEGGRRYDATLAYIEATTGPVSSAIATPARPGMDVGASAGTTADLGADADEDINAAELARLDALASEPLQRPPPFAPMVRPSPPKRTGAERVDQATLSGIVDTSMLVASPDGSASFEIAFDDEVFQNLACSITVTPAGVIATFKVEDANTRRLLEAEAGRLRNQLADRGLRVADVRVEMI
jgi:hypothetical protein